MADPARPQADYSSNGDSRTPHVAVAEDAGEPNAPMSEPGSSEWKARYPAGYGNEPPPDFQGRRSWHLIYTYGGGVWPKAGELWRFPVDATPGSSGTKAMRWVEVRILPGQERFLFAARPELRIPGAAPMTYVFDDPTPTTVLECITDNGPAYYTEVSSPPRMVLDAWGRTPLDAWGRTPEQAAAAVRRQRSGYAA